MSRDPHREPGAKTQLTQGVLIDHPIVERRRPHPLPSRSRLELGLSVSYE